MQNTSTSIASKTIIQTIAASLMLSVIVMSGAVFFIHSPLSFEASIQQVFLKKHQIFTMIFLILASSSGILGIMLPRLVKKLLPQLDENHTPGMPVNPDNTSFFVSYQNPNQKLLTFTVIRLALLEAVGIYGVIYSFMLSNATLVLPFAATSIFLQYLFGPFKKSA